MRATAIILLVYFAVGSLMPGMDFSQLAKMPALWKHYKLHRLENQNSEASFVAFLKQHFINPEQYHQHDSGANHKDLPLKTFDHSLTIFFPAIHHWQLKRPEAHTQLPNNEAIALDLRFPPSVFRPPLSV